MYRSEGRSSQEGQESQDSLEGQEGQRKASLTVRGKSIAAIMTVYLLGVFMGSVDMGIVTPARTVIQGYFGVDASFGIWMITIYSLAYAAGIPVMGKLADRFGRKKIFLTCIALFGAGSLACGLSYYTGNFVFLLIARVVQAIGGGGIMPIANAEFGSTFPPEKRGMALGLVGGIYGIANVIGSAFGSAILDLAGQANWPFIFYFNVPIAVVILLIGVRALPDNQDASTKKVDSLGMLLLVVITLCIMSGIRGIDFFHLSTSLTSLAVWPFLLAALALCPLFVFIEHRAEDPALNLSYFSNRRIVIVLVSSILTGVIMMGMLFVPQYAENCLHMASGSGGYFVLIIGLMSGAGAPMSGKMIDKMGARPVLALGFGLSVLGCLFLAFVTSAFPSTLTVVIGLLLAGLGMGFVMGTPLNYMMLENTDPHESNSALATLSLVRSVGTVIAPALLVGFIVQAGTVYQNRAVELLPNEVDFSQHPAVEAVQADLDALRGDPLTSSMVDTLDMGGMNLDEPIAIDTGAMRASSSSTDGSDATDTSSGAGNPTGNNSTSDNATAGNAVQLSAKALEHLENADVTTITDDMAFVANEMFTHMSEPAKANMAAGIAQALTGVEGAQNAMPPALASKLDALHDDLSALNTQVDDVFAFAQDGYLAQIHAESATLESTFQTTLNEGFRNIYLCIALLSAVGLALMALYRPTKKAMK